MLREESVLEVEMKLFQCTSPTRNDAWFRVCSMGLDNFIWFKSKEHLRYYQPLFDFPAGAESFM